MLKRLILFFLLSCLAVCCALAQQKWVVADEDLTVWDSPNYLHKLGMVHKGYEITQTGLEGDMIQFNYDGQTAYVATYCCKPLRETAEASSQETEAVKVTEIATHKNKSIRQEKDRETQEPTASTAEPATDTEAVETANTRKTVESLTFSSMVFNSVSSLLPPWIGFCLLLLALFAFFNVNIPGMFDKLAGTDVADIGTKCFRPLIALALFLATYYFFSSWDVSLAVLLTYEVVLLLYRTKKLGSIRAAAVEILYLAVVASILAIGLVVMFFLAGGRSSSGSRRKSRNDDDEVLISDQYGHHVRARRTEGNTYKGNDGHEYVDRGGGDFEKKSYDDPW